MFFALGMERVEARLRQVTVGERDVEEFLDNARPNELRELFRHGIGRAIELFRVRRRDRRTPHRIPATNGRPVTHRMDVNASVYPTPVAKPGERVSQAS